ncbi:glycoside hydrolase family 17 protein [Xylariomycetidae sp. FL0641]|nr:glycoside hydrolase family 17 protein [Xylariomycetidae sp. FL0641]
MKAALAVAALAAGANAGSVHQRHAHGSLHALEKKQDNSTCGCTTIFSTWYGEPTLSFPPVPVSTAPPATLTSTEVVVPTPVPHTASTTGTYTFPATTITLTETTSAITPSTTVVTGTVPVGGVTTVVSHSTVVTCPYASVSTGESTTTTVIATTSYVCPSAGTYTPVPPTTITATTPSTVTVPVVATFTPGTYTQPELTTVVTATSTTIWCPFDTPAPAPTTSSTAVVVPPPATTSSVVAPPPVATTTAQPTTSLPATSAASSSAAPSPSGGSGGGDLSSSPGSAWAIAYTPYGTTAAAGCKSESQIDTDIAAIASAGIKAVRVYSTDCDTLPLVGGACKKYGVQMILGIFVDAPGCDANSLSVSAQVSAIQEWAQWDLVDLIVVSNEGVQNGYCTPSSLAGLIQSTKSQLSYTGPYTTAETVNIWEQEEFTGAICDVVDIVGANAHAFFNTETTADQAGEFVKGQMEIINSVCPGKEGRVLETGWPRAGNALGKAVPGVAEQKQAIESLIQTVGDKSVIFSLTSDLWKSDNTPCGCEQWWGCADVLGLTVSI